MSHIIYGDESAEQPQVTGDSARNETAASIKGSHFIKRQIIWERSNNPRAAATRSWSVWNGSKIDLLQKGTGPEIRGKRAASCAIGTPEATALALPSTAVAQSCANVVGRLLRPPAPNPSQQMWCLLILDKGTD